jgi:hypothetical protein
MGSELVGIVVIGAGISQHRLARLADLVERSPHLGERRLPAAGEDIEVEHHRRHPAVPGGRPQGLDDVAKPILVRRVSAAEHLGCRRLRRLLDDRPVELEEERPALARAHFRVRAHHGPEAGEEEQHEEEDEGVLHPDQQLPDLARERHGDSSIVKPSRSG